MSTPVAFFDVDTRMVDERGERLVIGPRALPIEPQLTRLFQFARDRRIPVVATTCVQTPPITPVLRPGMTHIPLGAADPEKALAEAEHSLAVFIERCSCGDGDANVAACVYDVFHVNPHAAACIRRMNIPRWAVFGISLEYCLRGACTGLCRLGLDVTVLVDAVVPSPRAGNPTTKAGLAALQQAGAQLRTTAEFLQTIPHD